MTEQQGMDWQDYAWMAGRITALFGLSVAASFFARGKAPAVALVGGLASTAWDWYLTEQKRREARALFAKGPLSEDRAAYLRSLEEEERYAIANGLAATAAGMGFAKIAIKTARPLFAISAEAGKGLVEGLITAVTDGRIMDRHHNTERQRLLGIERPDSYSPYWQIAITAALGMAIPTAIAGAGWGLSSIKRQTRTPQIPSIKSSLSLSGPPSASCYGRFTAPPRSVSTRRLETQRARLSKIILPEALAPGVARFSHSSPEQFNALLHTAHRLHRLGVPEGSIADALERSDTGQTAIKALNMLHPSIRNLSILAADLRKFKDCPAQIQKQLIDVLEVLLERERVALPDVQRILKQYSGTDGDAPIAALRTLLGHETWISGHVLGARESQVFASRRIPFPLQTLLLDRYLYSADQQSWNSLVHAVEALCSRWPRLNRDHLRYLLDTGDAQTIDYTVMALYRFGSNCLPPGQRRYENTARYLQLLHVDDRTLDEKRNLLDDMIDHELDALRSRHNRYPLTIEQLRRAWQAASSVQVSALYYIYHLNGGEYGDGKMAVLRLFNQSLLGSGDDAAPVFLGYLSDVAAYVDRPDVLRAWFSPFTSQRLNFVRDIRSGRSLALVQGPAIEFMYGAGLPPQTVLNPDLGQDYRPDAFIPDLRILTELTSTKSEWALDLRKPLFEAKLAQIEKLAAYVARGEANAVRLEIVAKHPDKAITRAAAELLRYRVKEVSGLDCLIIHVMDMDDFLVYPQGARPGKRPVQQINLPRPRRSTSIPLLPPHPPKADDLKADPSPVLAYPAMKGEGTIEAALYEARQRQVEALPEPIRRVVERWLRWPDQGAWERLIKVLNRYVQSPLKNEATVTEALSRHGDDLDRLLGHFNLHREITTISGDSREVLIHRLNSLIPLSGDRKDLLNRQHTQLVRFLLTRRVDKKYAASWNSLCTGIANWKMGLLGNDICVAALQRLQSQFGESTLLDLLSNPVLLEEEARKAGAGLESLRRILFSLPPYLAAKDANGYLKKVFSTKSTDAEALVLARAPDFTTWQERILRFEIIGKAIEARPGSVIADPTALAPHMPHFRAPGTAGFRIRPHAVDTDLGLLIHTGHFSPEGAARHRTSLIDYARFIKDGGFVAPDVPASTVVFHVTGHIPHEFIRSVSGAIQDLVGSPSLIVNPLPHIAPPKQEIPSSLAAG